MSQLYLDRTFAFRKCRNRIWKEWFYSAGVPPTWNLFKVGASNKRVRRSKKMKASNSFNLGQLWMFGRRSAARLPVAERLRGNAKNLSGFGLSQPLILALRFQYSGKIVHLLFLLFGFADTIANPFRNVKYRRSV